MAAGEVYRATDIDLGPDVAIEVLPDAFANDPERLARFEREAKTSGRSTTVLAFVSMPGMAGSSTTTLYVRGVPRPVVREAKAAAAREGRTLGGWVSDRLARATGTSGTASSADQLRDDLAWYESRKAHLERKYAGQYVAIVGRAVVDHDEAFEALARRVFARFGARSICMPRVGRDQLRVRSPRRAAR